MSKFLLPINEAADLSVKQYTDAIVSYVKEMHPTVEVVFDYDEILNQAQTEKASITDIQTKYGFVTVFPDFNKNSAKAAMLNRGLISALELEGFDDEHINNAPIYGTLMPFSVENAEIFALILTNDFGLQHQKNL